jgi:anthranilate synthase/aminodeoxychorismate synthase-like glutamine amidotransferase
MICVIDNYDSFTYNLVQILLKNKFQVEVYKNDAISIAQLKQKAPHIQGFLISPGPGSPLSAGISLEVVKEFHNTHPLLGVCLGHQVIASFFGAEVVPAPRILHGQTSLIHHNSEFSYADMPPNFQATRYHSLIVKELPERLKKTAWTFSPEGQEEIMGFRHQDYPIEGIQFHPESILTTQGETLVLNFFRAKTIR